MDLNIQYVAGLFDGEGCVYFGGPCEYSFTLRVTITQCYKPIIDQLRRQFGGKVTVSPGTNKRLFRWDIATDTAHQFLEKIEPYTYVKRKEIKIALKYKGTISYSRNKVSKALKKRRIKWKRELCRLKRVGF